MFLSHSLPKVIQLKTRNVRTRKTVSHYSQNVDPEFISLYTKYVCPLIKSDCYGSTIIPDINKQIETVNTLFKIYMTVSPHEESTSSIGALLYFLMTDNKKATEVLVNTLIEYDESLDKIVKITEGVTETLNRTTIIDI